MHLRVVHLVFAESFDSKTFKKTTQFYRGETFEITIPFVLFGSPLDSRSPLRFLHSMINPDTFECSNQTLPLRSNPFLWFERSL